MTVHTEQITDDKYDPTHTVELGHGNTVAAWALVMVVSVGVIATGICLFISFWPGVIAGCAVIAFGIILGIALKAAGWGVGGKKTLQRQQAKGHH